MKWGSEVNETHQKNSKTWKRFPLLIKQKKHIEKLPTHKI